MKERRIFREFALVFAGDDARVYLQVEKKRPTGFTVRWAPIRKKLERG